MTKFNSPFGVNLEVVGLSVKESIPEAKPTIQNLLDELDT
jgi:uncharacterized protein with HEPN domain